MRAERFDELIDGVRAWRADVLSMPSDKSNVTPKRPAQTSPNGAKQSPQQATKDPHDEKPKWPGGGKKGEDEKSVN